MKRREFITLLGGAAAWPLTARAQQPAMPVIGYLSTGSEDSDVFRLNAFRRGLNETGFVEGQNVTIEYRWAQGQYDRLSALAADLVRRKVSVIYAMSTPSALAAKEATTAIPIVFNVGDDPVMLSLVSSLSRPGSNITGIALLNVEVMAKRLELLRELVPTVAVIALLVNPTSNLTNDETRAAGDAARALGLQLNTLNATDEREIDSAFSTLAQKRISTLVISTDSFFTNRRDQLVALAARHRMLVIYAYREFVLAGGLMSYGTNWTDTHRQGGVYTGRVLKGEKPADLPVQQVTRLELVINLKTAKALSVTVPTALLVRADEVIE
jgi:putative ABC transport system substrate-binding protein